MGKQLNLKDQRAIALAHDIARRKGISVTAAIRDLLEKEQRRMETERQDKIDEILAIAQEFRRKMPAEWRDKSSREIMDALHDEDGLPS